MTIHGGKKTEGHFHVFVMIEHCREMKIANVEAHVMLFWVLRTLLQWSLVVVMSVVRVVSSPG